MATLQAPRSSEQDRSATGTRAKPPALKHAARALTILSVVAATLAGSYLALVSFRQERDLSVGSVRLSVSPGHTGALDVYVPLVDWGARFEAIRLPARIRIDLRTVDRTVIQRVANGAAFDVRTVRTEARDNLAAYLRTLIGVVFLAGLSLGLLTAFAVRNRAGPKLRYTTAAATLTATGTAIALIVLIPPRGEISDPQYYAYGADIPRALEAVASVQRAARNLDQELDAQLVGLARLVVEPGNRTPVEGRPRITIASDLHNNALAIPLLKRTADRGPVFFAGDLTDRGSPIEAAATRRVVQSGKPFVFVSGNHDSDQLSRRLARDGAIVLTEFGRLKPNGGFGPVINEIAGLKVAGYRDPFERRANEDFRDRYEPEPTLAQQTAFTEWLRPLKDKVDVIMVHEPALIGPALQGLRLEPPQRPLVFMVGHTHAASLQRITDEVTVINGGSIGGGGTGNLADGATGIALARFIYDDRDGFAPLAADLVQIDPGTGAATARRERLDEPLPPTEP